MTDSIHILARCSDITAYQKDGHVYCEMPDGQHQQLGPPFVPFGINAEQDLSRHGSLACDADGYAWIRRPVLAFFHHDGWQLTVQWDLEAYESRYGWEYSHGRAQRKTWARLIVDDHLTWNWIETVDRPQQYWIHSAGDWTDHLKVDWTM